METSREGRTRPITYHNTILLKQENTMLGGNGDYGFFWYPEQERTGRRGYFGKRESVEESSQRIKTEPRDDSMKRACTQEGQRPTGEGFDPASGVFDTTPLGGRDVEEFILA
jgi:hypothetical protein